MRRLWGVLAAELILVFFLCFVCAGFESLAAGDGGVSWRRRRRRSLQTCPPSWPATISPASTSI